MIQRDHRRGRLVRGDNDNRRHVAARLPSLLFGVVV